MKMKKVINTKERKGKNKYKKLYKIFLIKLL